MLGWGIALMVMGALSFVLPLFGRQFIVVSLLGFSGMGSSVAGLVLIAIGVVVFSAARKGEQQNINASSSANRTQPLQTELRRQSLFSEGSDNNVITEKAFAAADAGDMEIQVLVGVAYLSGANGLPQNAERAFHYLSKAAMQGSGFASYVLAGMYVDGLGVKQDFDNARLCAVEAQRKGVADAEKMLAVIDSKRRA